jgi:hypothetical protein
MTGCPEVLRNPPSRRKKVSVILIDWSVRESFHAVQYLNQQTAARDDFELVWVEFYGAKPAAIHNHANAGEIDKWLVLGYPPNTIYHKHRAYNAGLLAATGDICVICDSDAIFRPTFIDSIIRAFDETRYAVIHLDEIHNRTGDGARVYQLVRDHDQGTSDGRRSPASCQLRRVYGRPTR